MYYDRKSKKTVKENEYKQKSLEFLYNTELGRFLLKLFIARPWLSKVVSLYHKSFLSKKDIKPFVKEYNVAVKQKDIKKFKSFNDFFIRKRNKQIKQTNKNELIAVADSKLSYYPITKDLRVKIKNSNYSIEELLENKKLASFFDGGTCLVFRLAVNDNHRYIYIDDGKLAMHKKIKGELHTIRPIAEEYNVFTRNSREVNFLNTKNFGYVVQTEVGALLIGKIKNNKKSTFKKNEEKGYFEFGGSTIVVLINKDIEFDEDIAKMNEQGIEIQVRAGERIGIKKE